MANHHKVRVRVACIECNRVTNHDILHAEEIADNDEDSGIHWGTDYKTVQCCGCEAISFMTRSWNSEDTDPDNHPVITTTLYPSRTTRKPIENYYYLPDIVRAMYQETLTAMSNSAPILAAIGIRAVVEAVCRDKACVAGNLETNIDLLVVKGHLAADQADFLHLQRFMGNAAAHEIKPPRQTELAAAMNIAENLLTNLYTLPMLAEQMATSQEQLANRKSRLNKSKTPKP